MVEIQKYWRVNVAGLYNMRVGAYCRVSTEKEAQLESLKNQKEFFQQFCIRQNHELVHIYADEGISGKQMRKRKQFISMIEDAKAGRFDVVAVKDVTRFARNTVDFLEVIRDLKAHGVKVIFVNHNMDSMEGSEFILTIFAAAAQDDSARLSKRVKFGKDMNAKKGRVPNLVYGYDKVDTFTLKINEEEAQVIKKIFEMYTSGQYGATKIAFHLNEHGYKTKRGGKWYNNSVTRILTNELYIGILITKKSEVVDFITGKRKLNKEDEQYVLQRPEYQIVDNVSFDGAKRILASRVNEFKLGGKRASMKYPLSNLIYCKECGYAYRRVKRQYAKGGTTYVRWACSKRNAQGKDACSNKTILSEEQLTSTLMRYIDGMLADRIQVKKDAIRLIKKRLSKYEDQGDGVILLSELSKLKKKKARYMEMYSEELITLEEVKVVTQSINLKISDLKDEMLKREVPLQDKVIAEKMASNLISWGSVSRHLHLQNKEYKKIVKRIDVDKEGRVTIQLN